MSKQYFHASNQKDLPNLLHLNNKIFNLPEPLPPNILPHASEMVKIAKSYFPNGLSVFGADYLTEHLRYCRQDDFGYISHSMTIDVFFELVRRIRFPSLPSRYESFFAWETEEEAKVFAAKKWKQGEANIFVVESDNCCKLDMSLLTLGNTYIEGFYFADKYWNKGQSDRPIWEYLLSFPVRVIGKI